MLSSQSKKTKKSSMMMRRRERGEVFEAPSIPLDMQIEILNRLPIKSLARFKCVSKLWSSLICSKGYLFASPPRLYISLVKEIRHSPDKFVLLSLTSTTIKSNTVFNIDSRMDGMGGHRIVTIRGLILYTFCGHAFIYNPTTEQRVTLPAINNILTGKEFTEQLDFLGYDPVLDQYKVVCTTMAWSVKLPRRMCAQHWWVFVLEAGSSWKRIEFDHPHIPSSRQGLCINGIIYYLASTLVSGDIIIGFDVRSEKFNMIQLPSVNNSCYIELIEYGEKPTIFDYVHLQDPSGLLNLWVLEDAGVWSRKSLVLQPFQKHLVPGNIYFHAIGTTQNGEVVLRPELMSYPYYILYYDLHKNDVRRVDIRGIWEEDFEMALMDSGQSIMHLKI